MSAGPITSSSTNGASSTSAIAETVRKARSATRNPFGPAVSAAPRNALTKNAEMTVVAEPAEIATAARSV